MNKEKEIQTHFIFPFLVSKNFRVLSLIVFLLSFGLYFNTVFNQYALDDGIVITDNPSTMKGLDGLSDLFFKDSFRAVSGSGNELSGGRYRPLSIASFALEIGWFGKNPGISHLINALLYGILCVLLFYFFYQSCFKNNISIALLAALLFAVHPLHTEVVANIKGRDDILALLFVLLSLLFYFQFLESNSLLKLFASLFFFFVSLLSKESGITFLALLPLSTYFFLNRNFKQAALDTLPFVLVFAGYFLWRNSIVEFSEARSTEVLNSPFVLASATEAFATKTMILGKYLLLLIWPMTLAYDYSYPQIPYVDIGNAYFIISILLNGGLLFYAFVNLKSRSLLSYSIFFYFITLSIVTNFLIDVGAPMNDRFLFQPSIGFAIALSYIVHILYQKYKTHHSLLRILPFTLFAFVLLLSIRTIARNGDWKNNETLFLADVKNSPNSAKTNTHAGVTYIRLASEEADLQKKKELLLKSEPLFIKAYTLYPKYADAYINLGNVYAQLDRLDESYQVLMKAKSIYRNNRVQKTNSIYLSSKLSERAVLEFQKGNKKEALRLSELAVDCDSANANRWYNLGGYYLSNDNKLKALDAWTKAHALDPTNEEIKIWLDRIK